MAVVHVPMSEAAEIIQSLLAAAKDLGMDPATSVKTSTDGMFGFSLIVPDEVHAKAFPKLAGVSEPEPEPEPEPAPKRKPGRPRKAAAEPVVDEEGDE